MAGADSGNTWHMIVFNGIIIRTDPPGNIAYGKSPFWSSVAGTPNDKKAAHWRSRFFWAGRVQPGGVAATLALNGLMLLFFAWELLGGCWVQPRRRMVGSRSSLMVVVNADRLEKYGELELSWLQCFWVVSMRATGQPCNSRIIGETRLQSTALEAASWRSR